jgi:two-component system, NtrC family, response regulator HydG
VSDPIPRTSVQRHILLIEDSEDVRDLVAEILREADYEVDAAATMSDGIALLHLRQYDLVISDAKLPDGSGIDIADAATDRGAATIIITGYDFTLAPEQRTRYKIMLKPFLPVELIHAVESALPPRS